MAGADRARHVVELGRARRGGVREREHLAEAVGVKAAVAVGIDEVGYAHGGVAAHGERDGHAPQHRVAPVGQGVAAGGARLFQKVDLTIDDGQDALRQLVLLDVLLAQLRRCRDAAEVPTRIAAVRSPAQEHAHRLVGLQGQAEVGRGSGVRFGQAFAIEARCRVERAALKVVGRVRRPAVAQRLRVATRGGHRLGDAHTGVDL